MAVIRAAIAVLAAVRPNSDIVRIITSSIRAQITRERADAPTELLQARASCAARVALVDVRVPSAIS